MNRQEKWQIAIETLINKMFEISGHDVTFDDIKDRKDEWYLDWTMTYDQNTEWTKWGKKYLMKYMRLYARPAEREMAMISLNWGLKFSENPCKSED